MTEKFDLVSAVNRYDLVLALCAEAVKETRRVEQCKLFALDWRDRPETLLYKVENKVFDDYLILRTQSGEVVCGAGFYRYSDDTTMLMSRFWTRPDMRVRWIGHILLQEQVLRMPTRYGMATINEANKPLYDQLSSLYGTEQTGESWPGLWRKFKPMGMQRVNYVDQYCLQIDKHELDL